MKLHRRHTVSLLGLALAGAVFAAPAAAHHSSLVFTSSNDASGNELLVYLRQRDGALVLQSRLPTGGLGSGAGLGSQGAVTLSDDGRFVFVVNAQSNSVSAFALGETAPVLRSVAPSGGLHPISVTESQGRVYVLNDGGSGNIAGLHHADGELQPLAGSARPLSAAGGTAPAQVGFSADGDTLVVTEKGSNRILSWAVRDDGKLGAPVLTASPGQTPFGFASDRRNHLIVTEAVGGAAGASTVSSYRFADADPARPKVQSASVPDFQGAACWVSVTPNGRFAFVANTGSSNLSRYDIGPRGTIALGSAVAGDTGSGSAPADTAVSRRGHHLYVRNGKTNTIAAFSIGGDGALSPESGTGGLPATAVGLAAD